MTRQTRGLLLTTPRSGDALFLAQAGEMLICLGIAYYEPKVAPHPVHHGLNCRPKYR